mmetsp:Transcript_17550/g.26415  ORF Transcript_17550/g.26415 Transcript_17550/m.26415 type:complete len:242 (-) Transcript_17550:518-1243(-)
MSNNPNDGTAGGEICFDFGGAMITVGDLVFIDNDVPVSTPPSSNIEVYEGMDCTGNVLSNIPVPVQVDGDYDTILIDQNGAKSMKVKFGGSGAIDDLAFCVCPNNDVQVVDGESIICCTACNLGLPIYNNGECSCPCDGIVCDSTFSKVVSGANVCSCECGLTTEVDCTASYQFVNDFLCECGVQNEDLCLQTNSCDCDCDAESTRRSLRRALRFGSIGLDLPCVGDCANCCVDDADEPPI